VLERVRSYRDLRGDECRPAAWEKAYSTARIGIRCFFPCRPCKLAGEAARGCPKWWCRKRFDSKLREFPADSLQIPWSIENRLCLCGSGDENFSYGNFFPASFPAQRIW